MTRGLTFRLLHALPPDAYRPALEAARAAGADTVALIPHHYCLCAPNSSTVDYPVWSPNTLIFPDSGQMFPGTANTPPIDNVAEVAWLARSLGLTVWLKPHVDAGWWHEGSGYGVGGWRGYVQVPPRRAYRWWTAYRAMLKPYVRLATQLGGGLVLGCELLQITRDYGAAVWIALAEWVWRQGFTGPLTYASNWGSETELCAPLWAHPAITHVGCDWYVPADQWAYEAAALRQLAQAAGKPILFTEVGFPNWIEAQSAPWHDWAPGDVLDDAAQLAGWTHFRQEWASVEYVAWEAPIVGLPALPVNHNCLRTPELARAVLGGA